MKLFLIWSLLLHATYVSSTFGAQVLKISNTTADFLKELQNVTSTSGSLHSAKVQLEANAYFDQFLKALGEYLVDNGLDPNELPDVEKQFSWETVPIYEGVLKFTKGWMYDFITMHRNGDVEIEHANELYNVKVPIGFETLMLYYDYTAELMDLTFSGGSESKIETTQLSLTFVVDLTKMEILLQDFKVKSPGKLELNWTGSSLVDWILNIFTNVTLICFEEIVVSILDTVIKCPVEELLDRINTDIKFTF